MYDLTINIDSEQSGLSYVSPGINENLKIAKPDNSSPIVYEKSKNGSEFIAFHFMNPEGQTFVHTEWVPSADDPDVLAKKQSNLVKRLLHIGKKLVDESLLKKIKVASFEELAKSYISIIGDNYKNKLFRAKIIYNNKNYTTFPNYVPFLESMTVEIDKSNLKMSADDKVVKSKADVIVTKSNPFTMSETPVIGEVYDKVPF
jgi:hypothetical protein